MAQTVLVTGASRGIGAAIAGRFARGGFDVWINYSKSREQAEALAENIGAKAICADIADSDALAEMVAGIGGIDILVNNAGIACYGLFDAVTFEDAQRVMKVNAMGTMNCTRLVLPHMLRKKYGRIINVSSVWGQTGASCEVDYSASKAAVIGFTKALAKETAPSGITVNCVCPGAVMTDMLACLSGEDIRAFCEETPMLRLGTPEDIAAAVYFLASEDAAYITGQILGINGGLC